MGERDEKKTAAKPGFFSHSLPFGVRFIHENNNHVVYDCVCIKYIYKSTLATGMCVWSRIGERAMAAVRCERGDLFIAHGAPALNDKRRFLNRIRFYVIVGAFFSSTVRDFFFFFTVRLLPVYARCGLSMDSLPHGEALLPNSRRPSRATIKLSTQADAHCIDRPATAAGKLTCTTPATKISRP